MKKYELAYIIIFALHISFAVAMEQNDVLIAKVKKTQFADVKDYQENLEKLINYHCKETSDCQDLNCWDSLERIICDAKNDKQVKSFYSYAYEDYFETSGLRIDLNPLSYIPPYSLYVREREKDIEPFKLRLSDVPPNLLKERRKIDKTFKFHNVNKQMLLVGNSSEIPEPWQELLLSLPRKEWEGCISMLNEEYKNWKENKVWPRGTDIKFKYLEYYLEHDGDPTILLKNAVRYFATHGIQCKFEAYNKVIEYAHKRSREYTEYTMKVLVELASEPRSQNAKVAFAILKAYNILQEVKNDLNLIGKIIECSRLLELFLNYGENFNDHNYNYSDIAHIALNKGNISSLRLLKKHGIDFSSPTFINLAQKTNFNCLSFLFLQQKKYNLQQFITKYIDPIPSSRIKFESNFYSNKNNKNIRGIYGKRIYKFLWDLHYTGDAQPLEEFICNMSKWDEIYKSTQAVEDDMKNDIRSVRCINEIISQFDYEFLNFLKKEPIFLFELLTKVKKISTDTRTKISYMIDEHANFKELESIKSVDYLRGILKGLQDKNGRAMRDFHEQKYEKELIMHLVYQQLYQQRIIITVSSLAFALFLSLFYSVFAKGVSRISQCSIISLGSVLSGVLKAGLKDSKPFMSDTKEKLFKRYVDRGKADGFAVFERRQLIVPQKPVIKPGFLETFLGVVKIFSKNLFNGFAEYWSSIKKIRIRAASN